MIIYSGPVQNPDKIYRLSDRVNILKISPKYEWNDQLADP